MFVFLLACSVNWAIKSVVLYKEALGVSLWERGLGSTKVKVFFFGLKVLDFLSL